MSRTRTRPRASGFPTGMVSHGIRATQPDDQPIVINTERIVTAAPAPPDGQGTRITFTNGGHQDVKELIADVLGRLHKSVGSRMFRSLIVSKGAGYHPSPAGFATGVGG
jgi:hypothetical protein